MPEALFPACILRRFVDALSIDLGHEAPSAVLEKGGLPTEWAHAEHDIEEASCCATGAADCKFKITIGV